MKQKQIAIFLFFLFYAAVLFSAPVTDDQKKIYIDEQLRLADGLMNRGYYDLAIEEYQQIISRFPDEMSAADAWSQLAEAFSAKGKYSESISTYNQFFKKFPHIRTADFVRINFAKTLSKTGGPDDLKESFSILTEIRDSEDKPELLKDASSYALGKVFLDKGEKEKAFAEFSRLAGEGIQSKDQIFRAYGIIELAAILKNDSKTGEAIKTLENLADNRNSPPEAAGIALHILASIYAEQKNYVKAAEIFEQIRVTSSDSQLCRNALMKKLECLYYAGEYGKLIQEADISLKTLDVFTPETNTILFLKGSAFQKQGIYQAASEIFSQILNSPVKDDQIFSRALCQKIQCLLSEKKKREAFDFAANYLNNKNISSSVRQDIVGFVLDNFTETDENLKNFLDTAVKTAQSGSEKDELLLRYADHLFKSGAFKEACATYSAVASEGDDEPRCRGLIGAASCLKALGQEDDALKSYLKVINDFHNSKFRAEALFRAALIYLSQKKNPDAQKFLENIRDGYPESQFYNETIFYLGYIQFGNKNWNSAVEYFRKIVEGKFRDEALKSNAMLYWGLSLMNSGNKPEAMRIFNKIMEQSDALKDAGPELLSMLGQAYLEEKNAKFAGICFKHLSGNSDLKFKQKGLMGLGLSEKLAGNSENALIAFRAAEKLDADPETSALARAYLGEILSDTRNKSEAVTFFEKCVDNPVSKNASARSRLGLAKILSESGESLKTANRYAMSVFILNDNPEIAGEAMILSMRLSLRLKNTGEAKTTFSELGKRFPELLKRKDVKAISDKLK